MRFVLLIVPMLLAAGVLQVGQNVAPALMRDQFERPHAAGDERAMVVAWDKSAVRRANTYFSMHPEMIREKKVAFVVGVSRIPASDMSFFILPYLQESAYPVLLSHNASHNASLPYQKGRLSVLCLDGKRITGIDFAASEYELGKLLTGGCLAVKKP